MKVEHPEAFFFWSSALWICFSVAASTLVHPCLSAEQLAHLWIRVGVEGQTACECSGTFPSQVKGGREWIREEYNIAIKNIYIWIILTCTQNRAAGCLVGIEQTFCQLCPFLAADCILFIFYAKNQKFNIIERHLVFPTPFAFLYFSWLVTTKSCRTCWSQEVRLRETRLWSSMPSTRHRLR